jgi:N-acetyl sugar amidotransferase
MLRCRTCCYPDTKPDLHFDATGQCSACRNYARRDSIDWDARREKLMRVLEECDGRVLVPSSGGKDSTYIALRLKELGADVTAITATTCHLTPQGRRNIDSLARRVRTIEVTPNMTVRAALNRIAFDRVGDPSWPEHVSIHRTPFRFAQHLGTQAIFYGECPNDQYGGPPGTEDTFVMTQRWASEFAGFLGMRADDFIGIDGITERDMEDYKAPTDQELARSAITAYFLGWFEPWDSHRNAEVAKASGMGFASPGPMTWWEHENQDSYQVALHDAAMYRKFGYGRLAAQISVDIRAGKITREAAMEAVKARDGLFPDTYLGLPFKSICEHMGMTESQAVSTLDRFTNQTLFARSEGRRPILWEFA